MSTAPTPPRSTQPLRAEHEKILASLHAIAERVETLGEQTTPQQMGLAREVLDFVRKQFVPHARAEEYTLYPATDWAAGEGSHITEVPRFEHQLVLRRCDALDKAIQRSEEHTSELQSRQYLVCRLLLEKKKKKKIYK